MKRTKRLFEWIKKTIRCRHAWEVKPNKRKDSKINAFLQCNKCGKTKGTIESENRKWEK